MSIHTNLSADGNTLTLLIQGRFDISLYKAFGDAYQPYIGKIFSYRLDFTQTTYIDSSAIGMLLMLRERAGGDKASIVLEKASPTIRDVFKVTHMDSLFRIE
ncbi:MAG: STAS domain-containing protein [Desulfobacterales bacterium]|nr:STAS domain-containing protein [Desulfobacterales bacterium]